MMRQLEQSLTDEQKYAIRQVIATTELENLSVTESAVKNLEDIAAGRKTTEQVVKEIKRKYRQ